MLQPSTSSSPSSYGRLLFCAVGICSSYLLYGMVQERLFLGPERLGAAFLVANQSCFNFFLALMIVCFFPNGKSEGDHRRLNHTLFVSTSLCYAIAMTASNEALNFVRYPTAVLCKSCKLIPTMLVGSWVEGTSYGWHDWSAAALMTAGIIQFHFEQLMPADRDTNAHQDTIVGLILLFLSLGMDGLLGACQNLLKRGDTTNSPYRPPTAMETMLYINLYALFFLVPWSMGVGQWQHAMTVLSPILAGAKVGVHKNYDLLMGIMGLNLTSAVGQLFIFWTITWYSPLMCTTITTTRKFITIVVSVFYFGHVLSSKQWLAVGMVFTGLYLSVLQEASESSTRNKRRAKAIKTQ